MLFAEDAVVDSNTYVKGTAQILSHILARDCLQESPDSNVDCVHRSAQAHPSSGAVAYPQQPHAPGAMWLSSLLTGSISAWNWDSGSQKRWENGSRIGTIAQALTRPSGTFDLSSPRTTYAREEWRCSPRNIAVMH